MPRPPEAFPPMTGKPGWISESQARNSSAGKVNGSATSTRALGWKPMWSGQPAKCQESSASRVAVSASCTRGPTRPAHKLMRRGLLDLTSSAHHRLRHAPDDGQRMEDRRHRADDVLQGTGVGPGCAHHHQVRALTDRFEHRAGDLPGGVGGDRVLGERAGKRHVALSRPPARIGCRVSGDRCEDRRLGWGRGRRAGPIRCDGCARGRGCHEGPGGLPVDPHRIEDVAAAIEVGADQGVAARCALGDEIEGHALVAVGPLDPPDGKDTEHGPQRMGDGEGLRRGGVAEQHADPAATGRLGVPLHFGQSHPGLRPVEAGGLEAGFLEVRHPGSRAGGRR